MILKSSALLIALAACLALVGWSRTTFAADPEADVNPDTKALMALKPEDRLTFVQRALRKREAHFEHLSISYLESRSEMVEGRDKSFRSTGTTELSWARDAQKLKVHEREMDPD